MYTILGAVILYCCFKFIRKKIGGAKSKLSAQDDPLEHLVNLLFDKEQSTILENIKQLRETPTTFVQKHRRIFEPYGIDAADEASFEELFKVLLAYHLGQYHNFVTLDWKQSGYDGLDSINWLLNNNGIAPIHTTEKDKAKRAIPEKYLQENSSYYLKTDELLTFLAAILTKEGTSLVELALGGDSYELFLLPNQKIPQFVTLMNQLDFDFLIMR